MQNYTEHIQQEVGPSRCWVNYLKWLGVNVEGPHQGHQEREE